MKRRIAILGSTGSIGTQALDVISRHPSLLSAEVLTANSNASLLIEQAIKHQVNSVVIADETKYDTVFNALDKHGIKVFCGEESISQAACGSNIDMVLTAMVGFSGLKPTIEAIKSGKAIALACCSRVHCNETGHGTPGSHHSGRFRTFSNFPMPSRGTLCS